MSPALAPRDGLGFDRWKGEKQRRRKETEGRRRQLCFTGVDENDKRWTFILEGKGKWRKKERRRLGKKEKMKIPASRPPFARAEGVFYREKGSLVPKHAT
ncbi:unnamed protein product, partial [Linum tenue]